MQPELGEDLDSKTIVYAKIMKEPPKDDIEQEEQEEDPDSKKIAYAKIMKELPSVTPIKLIGYQLIEGRVV